MSRSASQNNNHHDIINKQSYERNDSKESSANKCACNCCCPICPPGPQGPAGGVLNYADFYALMPPDNSATVAPGTDVSFPQDGPSSGSDIFRTGPGSFNLAQIGAYQILFAVSIDEAGQLILTLNGQDLPYTVFGRATRTSQIVGMAIETTTAVNSVLTVQNPAGNSTALTVTPLAGGEPMLRRDIIKAAAKKSNILFPIFTNGTYMDEEYFKLFDKNRNLLPIMSIEGEKEITDARRGSGIYDKLISNMDELNRRGLVFGVSVTVTTENIREVSSDVFLGKLSNRGCKAVIFVEFVPVTDDSKELAPGDEEREYLHEEIIRLRNEHPEMVYISFPGD